MIPRIRRLLWRAFVVAALVATGLVAGVPAAGAARPAAIASADLGMPAWTPADGSIQARVLVRLTRPVGRLTVRLRVYDSEGIPWQRTRTLRDLKALTYALPFEHEAAALGLGPGVYPVRVRVRASGSDEAVETSGTLLIADAHRPAVPVSVVVRVAGAPMRDPAGRFVLDPAVESRPRQEAEQLSQLATVRPDLRLTAAIAPILLEDWAAASDGYSYAGSSGLVEVSSDSTPALAYRRSLADLARAFSAGMPLLRGLYADPDLVGLRETGALETDAVQQLRLGSHVTSDTLASAGATRSIESTGLCVAGGLLPRAAVRGLTDSHIGFVLAAPPSMQASRAATVAPGAYRVAVPGEPTATAGGRTTVLVTDPAASAMLADPSRERELAAYLLEHSLAARVASQPVVVEITAGPGGARVADIQPTLAALSRLPWVRFATAASVAGAATSRGSLLEAPRPRGAAPAGYWTDVRRARLAASAFETAVGSGDADARAAVREVYVGESRLWAGPDGSWSLADRGRSYLDSAQHRADGVLGKVTVEVPRVTLSGSAGKIPVSIQNASNKTLLVRVKASSPAMRLTLREITTRLRPGENILSIPVDLGAALSGALTIAVTVPDTTLASASAQVSASYLDRFVLIGGVIVVLLVLLAYIRRRERASVERDASAR